MALKVVITQLLSTLVHKRENNLTQKMRRNYRWTFHPEEVVFYIHIYIYKICMCCCPSLSFISPCNKEKFVLNWQLSVD